MVRRDDDGSPAGKPDGNPWSRCDDLAGVSPASEAAGAPSSRPAAEGETLTAEAGYRKRASQRELISEKQVRGPQLHVKPAASTEKQPGSRAAHFLAKATPDARAPKLAASPGGVLGAARVQGEARNTRDPSRHLRPGEVERWSRDYFHSLGLHRLRGTVRYPEQSFRRKELA